MAAAYRSLTDQEIQQLQDRGCSATDWSLMSVSPDFQPHQLRAVHFNGRMAIGSGAVIENVGELTCSGTSRFGNGVEIPVINEAGGREVVLWEGLSAPLAYILAFYRYRPRLISALQELIQQQVESCVSDTCTIGALAKIRNCGILRDVRIGGHACLDGVQCLENGTVLSMAAAPTQVGVGVIARDFILAEGAQVTDGTLLTGSFVGQNARLQQFNAQHCLFFANCEAFLGEACAVFAGPHTVTHHKGTLLIAGYTSFFNAGSHTHQSNHMYRLGPNQQGVLERGCKTGSGAYLCWPARIGAFSFIKGAHYTNPDTSNFPFSYVIAQRQQTRLHPGAVLGSIGLVRDSLKWPQRDQRPVDLARDLIHYEWLNPVTVEQIQAGIAGLEGLQQQDGPLHTQRLVLSRGAVERGLALYRAALQVFVGRALTTRLEGQDFTNQAELLDRLRSQPRQVLGSWVDLAGLLVPATELETLLTALEAGAMPDLEGVQEQLEAWHADYAENGWSWARALWLKNLGKSWEQVGAQDVKQCLQHYQEAQQYLSREAQQDAQREFDPIGLVGYGRDGALADRATDAEAVRGSAESHDFLLQYAELVKRHVEQVDTLIARIDSLPPT